ncbi:MAG: hypothetical protein LBB13_01140, partial [Rickettsiales bacterium]|nr:hypothetical protein [Rickettsiales bacterium]
MNFTFRYSLAVVAIFSMMTLSETIAIVVNNLDELQRAIGDNEKEIAIKNTIDFESDKKNENNENNKNNGLTINYDNIIIYGSNKDAPGLLNGGNNHKLFTFGESAKNISLKNLHLSNGNLHLSNGNNEDDLYNSNGGGAIYLKGGILINLNNITFSNNKAKSKGGAIFSKEAATAKSNLIFEEKIIFIANESSEGAGGAIAADYSDLTFKGETEFNNNKSLNMGGAILLYSGDGNGKSSILRFENMVTFFANETRNCGGALYSEGDFGKKNTLIFLKKAIFKKNKITGIKGRGGAIHATHSNLTFESAAIFEENSGEESYGGAISAENSSLIFRGLTIFEKNNSKNFGGAIYSIKRTKLIFGGETIFKKNNSYDDGGAINSSGENAKNMNILEFRGNTTFLKNKTTGTSGDNDGGAIFAKYSSLIFGGLTIFEKNSSKNFGGAIFAFNGVHIEFRDGLRLIDNTTNREKSGAIDMYGSDNELAIIDIVQRNPTVSTDFKGNKSEGGGSNAIYMTEYSRLNFTVEEGNVKIFDVLNGDETKNTNIITIHKGCGWFSIEKGGSIENVKLVNRGNLKLVGIEFTELNPTDFINSGIIRFEILPGGSSAK